MTGVLILAGSRDGPADPLAQAFGVPAKCLVPVAGRPVIEYPLQAALDAPGVTEVVICCDDPAALRSLPLVRDAETHGRLRLVPACPNLAESILSAGAEAHFPLIITTADNALLTSGALAEFAAESHRAHSDATVALARRESVLAAHHEGQRRFYEFVDGAFSNCNLYWLRAPDALAAAKMFSTGGQFIKRPARMAAAFGLVNLLLFRLGRLSLSGMTRRVSRLLRVSIAAIEMRDGRLAIDVDNARSHAVAEQLLLRPAATAA